MIEFTVIVPVATEQVGCADTIAVGVAGKALTVTTTSALELSQPLVVWLTQYDVLPIAVVSGVGASELPVPPVDAEYHNKLVPVAVNGVAVAFKQYETGVVTTGAEGKALMVTTISALELSQPLAV